MLIHARRRSYIGPARYSNIINNINLQNQLKKGAPPQNADQKKRLENTVRFVLPEIIF